MFVFGKYPPRGSTVTNVCGWLQPPIAVCSWICPEKVYKDKDRTKTSCDRTSSNCFELKEGRFRLDIRKKFFTVRVVNHWNRLPGEVVEVPSLETFKARLDGALINLI